MSGEARLWLPYERPPLSLNDRHGHHHARGRAVAQVRRDVGWLARAARLGRHDHVTVQLHYTPVRRGRRDADNLVATLKVVCDALVDVGLVADDDPAHMTKPMPAIHRADPNWSLGPHRLWLTITPGPAPAPTDGTPPGADRVGGRRGIEHYQPQRTGAAAVEAVSPPRPDRRRFRHRPPERLRRLYCKWLRRHGVDPSEVALPGWIERRPHLAQLAYEAYQRGPDRAILTDEAREKALREVRVLQLEGAPLPWPKLRL